MKSNEKKNDVHPASPRLPTGNPSYDRQKKKNSKIEQASLSRESIALPVPAPVVVVTVSLYGTQQSHYHGYQD